MPRFSRISLPIAIAASLAVVVSLTACSGSAGSPGAAAPQDLLSILESGNHRALDSLDPGNADIDRLRARRADAPYALGRALEARGLDETARVVYQRELDRGADPWAGLSAVRLAGISGRRGNLVSAQGHAARAVELVPAFRDAWYALGDALYAREDFRRLREVLDTLPPPEALTAGEAVSPAALRDEAAVWRAVTAWNLDANPTAEFAGAFLSRPVSPIHERLYLYLFYRGDALSRFAPAQRLLMESVYRQERGETQEALRLLRMVEPEAVLAAVSAAAGDEPIASAGFWSTVGAMVAQTADDTTLRWLDRLREATTDAATRDPDTTATVDVLRAQAAATTGAPADRAAIALIEAIRGAQDPEIRRRATDAWIDEAVLREMPLAAAATQLAALEADPAQFARAVDRLLPALVRRRAWGEIADVLRRMPDGARVARGHLAMVLLLAQDGGVADAGDTADRASLQAILEDTVRRRSSVGYLGMMGRHLAGLPLVVDAEPRAGAAGTAVAGAADATAGTDTAGTDTAARDATHPETWSLNARLAEALALAGTDRRALLVAMDAARDPAAAPVMIRVAETMHELGHVSNALDVARRAVSRAEVPVSWELVPLLFPTTFHREIAAAAGRFSVPEELLTALVREESHFRPGAASPVGAQGLGQLMPATAADIRRRMDWPDADVGRPADNLTMSAYYLDYLAGEIESPVLRLAAYNAGLGRGRRWETEFGDLPPALQIEALPFVETRWYLRRIAASQAMYAAVLADRDPGDGLDRLIEGDIW